MKTFSFLLLSFPLLVMVFLFKKNTIYIYISINLMVHLYVVQYKVLNTAIRALTS